MKNRSIAIDGPSGAGKSTVARLVAKQLGYIYVDTGAMYRTVGLFAKRCGVDPKSDEDVASILESADISIKYDSEGVQRIFLNGEDVSDAIRTPEMSMYASNVSAHPVVRAFLLDRQRKMAEDYNVIMDGRDIGTVVLPEAGLKIFLTASAEARAKRRYIELIEKGQDVTYDDVYSDIIRRDEADSTRKAAPLKAADDAVLVDTSDMSLEESISAITEIVEDLKWN